MGAGGVDDGARDDGTKKRGSRAKEVEKREEEELFAARRHLGNLVHEQGWISLVWKMRCCDRGVQNRESEKTAYHDLRIAIVPRYETPPGLKHPEFPRIMKPNLLRPDSCQTPQVEEKNTENDPAVHSFVSEVILVLNGPITIDSNELSRPTNHV